MGSDWMKEVWACGSLGGTTTVMAVLVSQPDTAQIKANTTTAATLAAIIRRFSCMAIPPFFFTHDEYSSSIRGFLHGCKGSKAVKL